MPDKLYNTLDDLDVNGKLVLVRADLNVPINKDLQITDESRINLVAPTLTELSARGARTILISHLGRPSGKPASQLSLGLVSESLSNALGGIDIMFASNCIGTSAQEISRAVKPGDFALLENLRFHRGEEANDPHFAAKLSALGEIYINDAFSTSHRPHASVVGVPALLPNAAGRLMQTELDALSRVLSHPDPPAMAIIGGAKISTKLKLIGNLIDHVEVIAIGGGMANTFLYSQGIQIGTSICEPEMADEARAILARANANSCEILLPIDAMTLKNRGVNEKPQILPMQLIAPDTRILDIGPASTNLVSNRMSDCRTLLWNGPMGMFETPPFDTSTNFLAQKTAAMTQTGSLVSVAGGGDTLAALKHSGTDAQFTYVSSAGGAFLEWLEGGSLPGVEALKT